MMQLPINVEVPFGYKYIGNGRDKHMIETGDDCLMWSFDDQGWTDGVLEDLQPHVWYAVKEEVAYEVPLDYQSDVSGGIVPLSVDSKRQVYDPVTGRLFATEQRARFFKGKETVYLPCADAHNSTYTGFWSDLVEFEVSPTINTYFKVERCWTVHQPDVENYFRLSPCQAELKPS